MTWALFRKDLRLFRVPFITGLVILAGAYLVGAIVAVGVWGEATRDARRAVNDIAAGRVVAYAVVPAALVALGLTAFLTASFGGGAFAVERRDRSADFLAMLPIPRWRIAASKLLAVLLPFGERAEAGDRLRHVKVSSRFVSILLSSRSMPSPGWVGGVTFPSTGCTGWARNH